MDAQIQVSGGDEVEEFAELWRWLRGERALAGMVRAVPRRPGQGEMGGAFDMLAVALGSGGAGAMLAQSLTAWLRTRRPQVEVTVTSTTGSVTVSASNLRQEDALPLLEQVLRDSDV
jgi:membrane-associated two-gene conflict system component 1 (EACC1)